MGYGENRSSARSKGRLINAHPPPRSLNRQPDSVVQILTEEEAATHQEAVTRTISAGTSAWNASGTFEERDVTSWAKKELEDILSTSQFIINSCTGVPTSSSSEARKGAALNLHWS